MSRGIGSVGLPTTSPPAQSSQSPYYTASSFSPVRRLPLRDVAFTTTRDSNSPTPSDSSVVLVTVSDTVIGAAHRRRVIERRLDCVRATRQRRAAAVTRWWPGVGPVDAGRPCSPVLVRGQPRTHRVEQWKSFVVGEVRGPSHDAVELRRQQASELARARAQIDNCCRPWQARHRDGRARAVGATEFIVLWPPIAASGRHVPCRCHLAARPYEAQVPARIEVGETARRVVDWRVRERRAASIGACEAARERR
jgi:hypothetical protein